MHELNKEDTMNTSPYENLFHNECCEHHREQHKAHRSRPKLDKTSQNSQAFIRSFIAAMKSKLPLSKREIFNVSSHDKCKKLQPKIMSTKSHHRLYQ